MVFEEDEIEFRNRASKILKEYKKAEKKIQFHSERIGKNTIVFCKNKENIDKYKNQLKVKTTNLVFKN